MITVSFLHVLVINMCFSHYCRVFFTIISVPELGDGKLSVIAVVCCTTSLCGCSKVY